ncbi:hypothetical protein FOL47_006951 [Perkinsus chesapeaki]|uniref:Kinesin motor domain-containing protein n=1 Tax=Perkinsus chesapeaki TaxID=330153 RepID=A0A7J6N290_PERCH|nr:hypothetical protein FOL47_006951 [Perkinsus chesapeaki]
MYQESLNTLQFADRCKNVRNRPVVGYSSVGGGSQDWRVRRLLQEITELKAQLALAKSSFEQRVAVMNEQRGGDSDRKSVKKGGEGDEPTAEEELLMEAEALRGQIAAEKQKARRAEEKAERLKEDWQHSMEKQFGEEEAVRREKLEFMDKCRAREVKAAREVEVMREERDKTEKEMKERIGKMENVVREAFYGSKQNKLTDKMKEFMQQLRDLDSSCRYSIQSAVDRLDELRVSQLSEQKAAYEEALRAKEIQWRHWKEEADMHSGKIKRAFIRYRAEKHSKIALLKEELLRLYSVNRSLCRVVADLEDGRYAVKFSSGVKRAVLPASVAKEVMEARRFTEEKFPMLFEETRKIQRALREYDSEQKLIEHEDSL